MIRFSNGKVSDRGRRLGGRGRPASAFIACSALGKEVRELIARHRWSADFIPLDARYHLYPKQIEEAVEKTLCETDDQYDKRVVVYGQCGCHHLDDILARHPGAVRPVGPHCYEMFGGEDLLDAVREVPGTYFLTDYLVQVWDKLIVRGLKLDKHPKLIKVMFGHYRRMIYFAQENRPELVDKARAIADSLGLDLEVRSVGYGHLEDRLLAIMNDQPQPPSMAANDPHAYSYPVAGSA